MTPKKLSEYEPVDASPVKSFFVSMLTRDITLEEAILDLLDNCVDGILRLGLGTATRPYSGYQADIDFDKRSFTISDNCGGIPWDLHNYAFRMGRSPEGAKDNPPGSIGVYGIGMKRAIFKLGKHALISTQHESSGYEVEITPKWIEDEENWRIPVKSAAKSMRQDGTTIVVGNLHSGIAQRFGEDAQAFTNDLDRMIGSHYAFIIDKGFTVKINSIPVRPKPTRLIFTKPGTGRNRRNTIQPYIFKTATPDGVTVFLAVGFTQRIPSQDEAVSEQEETKYSSLDAGWTVLCNDRAVLYCDRSELTGWGEAGIPRYHNQFIAISGIVEFKSDDASKLPTTTNKRGIDASSALYLRIKNKMREGMRLFTDYTNKWKDRAKESRKHIDAGSPLSFEQIKEQSRQLKFKRVTKSVPAGEQYRPSLPMPPSLDGSKRRISFTKSVTDVQVVSEHLFDDSDRDPSEVGEKCFDLQLEEAKK